MYMVRMDIISIYVIPLFIEKKKKKKTISAFSSAIKIAFSQYQMNSVHNTCMNIDCSMIPYDKMNIFIVPESTDRNDNTRCTLFIKKKNLCVINRIFIDGNSIRHAKNCDYSIFNLKSISNAATSTLRTHSSVY